MITRVVRRTTTELMIVTVDTADNDDDDDDGRGAACAKAMKLDREKHAEWQHTVSTYIVGEEIKP